MGARPGLRRAVPRDRGGDGGATQAPGAPSPPEGDAILPAVEAVRENHPELTGTALYEASAEENVRRVVEQIETDSAMVEEFMKPCSPTTEDPVNSSPTDEMRRQNYALLREIVPIHANTSP